MSQGPTQWQLERLESRMVLCHTREKKAASCFPGSAGGSGGQTYPLVFFFHKKKHSSRYPICKGALDLHRGYAEEGIGGCGAHTAHRVGSMVDDVVFSLP